MGLLRLTHPTNSDSLAEANLMLQQAMQSLGGLTDDKTYGHVQAQGFG